VVIRRRKVKKSTVIKRKQGEGEGGKGAAREERTRGRWLYWQAPQSWSEGRESGESLAPGVETRWRGRKRKEHHHRHSPALMTTALFPPRLSNVRFFRLRDKRLRRHLRVVGSPARWKQRNRHSPR